MHVSNAVCVCDMSIVVAAFWAQIDPSSAKSALHCACWKNDRNTPDHKHLCVISWWLLEFCLNLLDCVLSTSVPAIRTGTVLCAFVSLVFATLQRLIHDVCTRTESFSWKFLEDTRHFTPKTSVLLISGETLENTSKTQALGEQRCVGDGHAKLTDKTAHGPVSKNISPVAFKLCSCLPCSH